MRQHEVVVIGAGVLGRTVTFELARRGIPTVIVGTSSEAPGTSSAAAGAMLGVLGEVEAARTSEADDAEFAFRVRCGRNYAEFLDAIEDASCLNVPLGSGTFVIANPVNSADRRNLDMMRSRAAEAQLSVQAVDPTDVPGLLPSRGYECLEAIYLENEGFVPADMLLVALELANERHELVSTVVGRVTHLETLRPHGHHVVLEGGAALDTPTVVLAAGVGIHELTDSLPELQRTLPRLLGGKGASAVVTSDQVSVPHVIRTPNRDFACGTHVVPRSGSQVYLGATNRIAATPGSDKGISPGELHALFHSTIHEINVGFRTARIDSMRFGLRPLTIDRLPLVGATAIEGVFIATGTYRNGVLMAPGIGAVVADAITGSEVRDNPFAPTAPDRRAARALPRHVVHEGLRKLVSFMVEPGGHLPYDRERELECFIQSLGVLALGDGPSIDAARDAARAVLQETPLEEVVTQLFYQFAENPLVAP